MDIKTALKASVAGAALFAFAAPVATTANAADNTFSSGNKNSLTMSGFVARSLYWADDGSNSGMFNESSSTPTSRVRWVAKGTVNESLTAGATIELDIPHSNQHGTFDTKGDESGADDSAWGLRHEYVWAQHKTGGKVYLGRTSDAGDGVVGIGFGYTGGTPGNMTGEWLGQNINFRESSGTTSRTSITVGGSRDDMDTGGRTDVIRYDTPKIGGAGIRISLSDAGEASGSLRYSGKAGALSVKANIGADNQSSTSTTLDYGIAGAFSVLHDSGLNATISGGRKYLEKDKLSATVGPQHSIGFMVGMNGKTALGKTGVNLMYSSSLNVNARGSRADTIGVTAGQSIDAIGATVALSYRNYDYQNNRVSHQTIDSVDVFGLSTVFNF